MRMSDVEAHRFRLAQQVILVLLQRHWNGHGDLDLRRVLSLNVGKEFAELILRDGGASPLRWRVAAEFEILVQGNLRANYNIVGHFVWEIVLSFFLVVR